jgi:dienelactone hydrolase
MERRKFVALLGSTMLAALSLALLCVSTRAQSFVRMEIIPVPSVTLNAQQILIGETNGKPAMLAGQLRIPRAGTEKLPAIIMMHGSGGSGFSVDRWAQEFNSIGIATFALDSFAGRGIVSTSTDQSQLDHLAMMVDAYRALDVLAKHSRIDPVRIAIVGVAKGAVAAVYSSSQRFKKTLAAPNTEFAAHIGLYTPCYTAYRDSDRVTPKPIRMFHGIADDWAPIEPCRVYVAHLKQSGADVILTEYPDTFHGYDNPAYAKPLKVPQGQNARNCALEEGDNGEILNARTKQPFTLNDPCMERGAQVIYNEISHKATVAAVKEFLTATFKLKE